MSCTQTDPFCIVLGIIFILLTLLGQLLFGHCPDCVVLPA